MCACLDTAPPPPPHPQTLQLYTRLGLRCTHVHSAIEFDQKPFFAEYCQFNTVRRSQATDDFSKAFYKNLNNFLYGKCCEDVRKRCLVDAVQDRRRLLKKTGQPTYKGHVIISESLVLVERHRLRAVLNKPIFISAAILDLAKYSMYRFHYETMPTIFDSYRLCYTDTDSFIYALPYALEEVWRRMLELAGDEFDFSNFPSDHPCGRLATNQWLRDNKKKINKMKVFMLTATVCLRPVTVSASASL